MANARDLSQHLTNRLDLPVGFRKPERRQPFVCGIPALELCEDGLSDLSRLDDGTPQVSALDKVRSILVKAKGGEI